MGRTLLRVLVKDGPVRFFQLVYIMFRYRMRQAFDANTRTILLSIHIALTIAGIALTTIATNALSGTSGFDVALRLLVGTAGVALCFVGATWFLMPAFQRATLLTEVWASTLYGVVAAAFTWLTWDKARAFGRSGPEQLVAFAIVWIGLLVAFGHPLSLFLRHRLLRLRTNHYAFETPYHQILALRPTRGQYRQIAIHEAGHALMYGLGDSIPEDAIAYIDTDTISPNLGQVSLPHVSGGDLSVDLLEWKLVTYLAGMAAENINSGTHGIGATGDLRGWNDLAGTYLTLCRDVVYFDEPKTDLQIESNKREMVALKKRMLVAVTRYLRANWPIVLRIADSLEEVECLDYQQLAGLLSDAVLTGHLPKPIWPQHLVGVALRPKVDSRKLDEAPRQNN